MSQVFRPEPSGCKCHKCMRDVRVPFGDGTIPYAMTRMILCPTCGNKRCPHASDHDLPCTGSNESGQPGSVYGGTDVQALKAAFRKFWADYKPGDPIDFG